MSVSWNSLYPPQESVTIGSAVGNGRQRSKIIWFGVKNLFKRYIWEVPSKKKNVSQLKVLLPNGLTKLSCLAVIFFSRCGNMMLRGASQSKAKKLLKLALEAVGMPDEISGSPQETAELISHFSDDIRPNENFWKIFSRTVLQLAFPGRSLAKPGNLQTSPASVTLCYLCPASAMGSKNIKVRV